MKLTAWQLFKAALAISAGYEFGRILPGAVIRLAHKQTIRDVKEQYHRRMHVVRNETPTTGA